MLRCTLAFWGELSCIYARVKTVKECRMTVPKRGLGIFHCILPTLRVLLCIETSYYV